MEMQKEVAKEEVGAERDSCADQSDNDVTGSGGATPTMIR